MFKKIILSVFLSLLLMSTIFISNKNLQQVHANVETLSYQGYWNANVWNGLAYIPLDGYILIQEDYDFKPYGVVLSIQSSHMAYDGWVLPDFSYSRTEYFSDGDSVGYSPIYEWDTRSSFIEHYDWYYKKWEPDDFILGYVYSGMTTNTHTITFQGGYSPNKYTIKKSFGYIY